MTSKFVITNVRIFNGEELTGPTSVVIDGDKIGNDATGATEVDGEGGILLPGLIDCHVHLRSTDQIDKLCSWGVTTALDMGLWPTSLLHELRQYANNHPVVDIRSAGLVMTAPGSTHSKMPGIPPDALLTGPEQAESFVAGRLAEGADYIKVVADIPGPDQATLDAVVSEARNQGKISVAHASRQAAVAMAQKAKVDVLTHVPLDKPLEKAQVEMMKAENRVCIPTLAICEKLSAAGIIPGLNYPSARDSVSAIHSARVPIFAGTDANTSPIAPVFHGRSLHHELQLLVEAGLSPKDALRASTLEPAKYFGLHDRGVIEPGKRADMILITENPLHDIAATKSIKRVWCRGVEYQALFQ